MVAVCPRTSMKLPGRQLLLKFGQDFVHVLRDAAQVAVLNAGVNVVDRLHVVVADHGGGEMAIDAGDVPQKLRRRAAPGARVCRAGLLGSP